MPVPNYETYCKMLDRARERKFAYPAVNVASLTAANAVLKGLAESGSDGILQVSTGGAAFISGSSVKEMVAGAISIAEHVHRVANVVLATGGTARPRRLGIPGEDLPHVRHSLGDPHRYFKRRLLVVGGRNSAAEAALRAHHVFADVALSYRGEAFDPRSIKYWLLPELEGYIKQQEIRCYFRTQPQEITPTDVTLKQLDSGDLEHLPVDDVLVLIGFTADMSLFETAGVQLQGEDRVPAFDEQTMETDVPGIYVAGTAVAGTQQSYQVFLENCHIHVDRIVAAITGAVPPAAPPPNPELEA